MKSFKSFLLELFDSGYNWKWVKRRERMWGASFYDGETQILVYFWWHPYKEAWEVEFGTPNTIGLPDTDEILDSHNALKILTTIVSVIRDFIKSQDEYPTILFGALKGEDKLSRGSVYRKMIKRMLPPEYKVRETREDFPEDGFSVVEFILEPTRR